MAKMTKICEKCMKKYEESMNTCLMCGTHLKLKEECREIFAKEGMDFDKEFKKRLAEEKKDVHIIAAVLIIIAIGVLVFVLIRQDQGIKAVEHIGASSGGR